MSSRPSPLVALGPLTLATALALAGCGSTSTATLTEPGTPPPTTAVAGAANSEPGSPAAADTEGRYIDLAEYQADPGAYADRTVVLFFHAPWCPDCRATETSLATDGVPAGLVVVKVDYDSSTDLKRRYGVTYQHTFVAVDAAGDALKKWSGSPTGADILAKAGA